MKILVAIGLLFFSNIFTFSQSVKVIIDADTGNEVDDFYAIVRALKAPELDIVGLTAAQWKYDAVCHVNTAENSWELNNKILNLMQLEQIPSLKGSETKVGSPGGGREPRKSEATDFIIEQALKMTGDEKLVIICTGAVTNIASAILLNPVIADKIAVYAIGTFYHFDKNAWDKNEFNVRNDLNAFDALCEADNLELHVMPANVVTDLVFYEKEIFENLTEKEGIEKLLCDRWIEVTREKKSWIFWDLALIEAIINPELATSVDSPGPPENTDRMLHLYKSINANEIKSIFWKTME